MPGYEQTIDFSTFRIGIDDVYAAGDGVIPDLATAIGFDLTPEPDVANLGRLVHELGPDKVLRNNALPELSLADAADLVERGGTHRALSRSLWTPEIYLPEHLNAVLATGGTANGQDRVVRILTKVAEDGATTVNEVYFATGDRLMDSATECMNPNVAAYYEEHRKYPTESQYTAAFVKPQLEREGYLVTHEAYETDDGNKIATRFAVRHSALFQGDDRKVSVVRVAGGGIQAAIQMLRPARDINSQFNADPTNPQLFVQTDGVEASPLALTEEQVDKPHKFSDPRRAARQLALTARYLLKEAQQAV